VLEIVTLPAVSGGPGLDGAIRFAAVKDGERLASGELLAWSDLGDETGRAIRVRWASGRADAGRAVIEAAVLAAGPGTELHLTANTQVDDRLGEQLALFESCGFTLWQEKEGFWWADAGQDLPAPQGVAVRTLAEAGRERYAGVVAACTAGTLDRIDADAVCSMGGAAWAAGLIGAAARPGAEDGWLIAENTAGEAFGYVAVAEFGPRTGTIAHIGVTGAHRGHRHVDQLLMLANRAARGRGWTGMLSDVDVQNTPMLAAMARNGHRAENTPWHRWMYRLLTPQASDAAPHAS
jgi:hypothetical protein